jgi:hypothetical protein
MEQVLSEQDKNRQQQERIQGFFPFVSLKGQNDDVKQIK